MRIPNRVIPKVKRWNLYSLPMEAFYWALLSKKYPIVANCKMEALKALTNCNNPKSRLVSSDLYLASIVAKWK